MSITTACLEVYDKGGGQTKLSEGAEDKDKECFNGYFKYKVYRENPPNSHDRLLLSFQLHLLKPFGGQQSKPGIREMTLRCVAG